MLAGNNVFDPGAFELISTTTLTATTAQATLTGLDAFSSEYKHLQIRSTAKCTNTNRRMELTFNGVTTASYAYQGWQWISTTNPGGSAVNITGDTDIALDDAMVSSSTAGGFTSTIIDFFDAYSTLKNKLVRIFYGNRINNDDRLAILSGYLSGNTAPLTSVTLTSASGSFAVGSRFSLYGIKG